MGYQKKNKQRKGIKMKAIHLNKAEALKLARSFAQDQNCETDREMFDTIAEHELTDFFDELRRQFGYQWRSDRKLFIKSV